MRLVILPLLAAGLLPAAGAPAQWIPQNSHSTASLRGVHSIGNGVAWASGTRGTVLRTTDGGANWQVCAVAAGAEKLDFRAVQAMSADVAFVMSAGTGEASRVYKTTDGCRTWMLVFTNPDKDGFWDGLKLSGGELTMIGDPVEGVFPVFTSADSGATWKRAGVEAKKNQSLFAASNSSMVVGADRKLYIVTGGGTTAFIADGGQTALPLATGEAAGGFALASRGPVFVAVGGDYKLPAQNEGTAAYRGADGVWHAAQTPPHGYRSAVAWNAAAKTWIAVGPNGTDVSSDDGQTWKEAPDEIRNWNAVSLPFAVGSGGRIGRLIP